MFGLITILILLLVILLIDSLIINPKKCESQQVDIRVKKINKNNYNYFI